jgi:hypothetical protein
VPAGQGDALEYVFGLRDDVHPVLALGLGGVDRDDLAPRCVEVGLEPQHGAVVAKQAVLGVEVVQQRRDVPAALGQILEVDPVLLLGALPDVDDQGLTVVGDHTGVAPLGLLGVVVDQFVLGLGGADLVEVQLLVEVDLLQRVLGLGVAAVEEAAVVVGPGGAAELDPLEGVLHGLAGLHVQHGPGVPVRTTIGAAVGHVSAGLADRGPAEGDGAVLGPAVGVQQQLGLGVEAVGDVQLAVVPAAVVVVVEVAASVLSGLAVLLVGPQLFDPVPDGLALGHLGEVAEGQLVLGLDPGTGLLGVRILHPAVGIRNLDPVVAVDLIPLAGGRILPAWIGGGGLRLGGLGAAQQGD